MQNIKETIKAAELFIERAKLLLTMKDNDSSWTNPKQQGSLRRSSMELTRSLAQMRKP